jgi:hypothetical protein
MRERRGACRVLMEGNRPLGRPRRRWEDNVRTHLKAIFWEDEDCVDLAEDRDRWQVLVKTVMILQIP